MKLSLYWSNRERGVVMLALHLLFACTNISLLNMTGPLLD